MTQIKYESQLGSRGRGPWALVIKGNEVAPFEGKTIQGMCYILSTTSNKNGKWSSTSYDILLTDGVQFLSGHTGWDTGRFTEGLAHSLSKPEPKTWAELARLLGVSVPATMRFLRAWRPKAAENLDKVDEIFDEVEESNASAEVVEITTINFGGPNNRQRREGFWTSNKSSEDDSIEIGLIAPNPGAETSQWNVENIRLVRGSGKVIRCDRSGGRNGGWVAVQIARAK